MTAGLIDYPESEPLASHRSSANAASVMHWQKGCLTGDQACSTSMLTLRQHVPDADCKCMEDTDRRPLRPPDRQGARAGARPESALAALHGVLTDLEVRAGRCPPVQLN